MTKEINISFSSSSSTRGCEERHKWAREIHSVHCNRGNTSEGNSFDVANFYSVAKHQNSFIRSCGGPLINLHPFSAKIASLSALAPESLCLTNLSEISENSNDKSREKITLIEDNFSITEILNSIYSTYYISSN